MSGLEWLAVGASILLIAFAAFLAMAETAFTHLGRARAEAIERSGREPDDGDAEDGDEEPGLLTRLVARRTDVLNPILFLLVVCHLALATIVGVAVFRRWGVSGVVIALAVEVVVVFIVAEAAPKTFALERTDRAARRAAPVVRALAAFPPLRWITAALIWAANRLVPGHGRREGPAVSEDELLALAGAAAEADVIEAEEQALIESIIEFGDTIAREVMVPRTDMVTVAATSGVADAIGLAIEHGFSRLPATAASADDITGIVYAKDLMRAEREGRDDREVATMVREAHFVPETKKVAELLREMQAEQFHIAIVIDEYGGTAGLVTLEDVLEELVGEIHDEFDTHEPMVEPAAGGIRVNARMPIDELNELLDSGLPEGDWDTVGGLLFNLLGRVPAEGEGSDVDGLRLVADRVQGRRIARVRISRI